MLTDRPPKEAALLTEFRKSDSLGTLEVPQDGRLVVPARSVEAAMNAEDRTAVRRACAEFLARASDFYRVSQRQVRVLAARPLRVREGGWGTELFGDYDPEAKLIRVWMRTAVLPPFCNERPDLDAVCALMTIFDLNQGWIAEFFRQTLKGVTAAGIAQLLADPPAFLDLVEKALANVPGVDRRKWLSG
jgi:hypothetical protein